MGAHTSAVVVRASVVETVHVYAEVGAVVVVRANVGWAYGREGVWGGRTGLRACRRATLGSQQWHGGGVNKHNLACRGQRRMVNCRGGGGRWRGGLAGLVTVTRRVNDSIELSEQVPGDSF